MPGISRTASMLPEAIPANLMLPLDAASALYDGMNEKSPGLLLKTKKETPRYSGKFSHILSRITTFRPTSYSMSAESVEVVATIIAEMGAQRILEFGAGVTTFTLPVTIGARLEKYISIEEDADYADTVRRELRDHDKYAAVSVHQLASTNNRGHVINNVDGSSFTAARFIGLSAIVQTEFGDNSPDLVLIDGPSRRVRWGRFSALLDIAHLLRPGTLVLLDDALRFREVSIMMQWRRLAIVNILGICCIGTGLGVARIV